MGSETQPNPFSDERRKFREAMLAFAKRNIQIRNTGVAKDGGGKIKHRYPELSKIVEIVRPALAECRLVYSWSSEPCEGDRVKVTCMLECVDSEHAKASTASMVAAAGKSREGKDLMSPGQAMVAATTFCRRVTLLDVTGLVGDVDIDGEGLAGSEADQGERQEPLLYVELRKMLAQHPDVVKDEGELFTFYNCNGWDDFPRDAENLNHVIGIVRTRLANKQAQA